MFSEWQEGKDTFLTADNEEAVLPRAQEAVSMDLVLKVDYFRGCAMLMDLVLEADYLRDSVLGSPVATQRQALKAVARTEASQATSSDRSSHHQSVKGMSTCARLTTSLMTCQAIPEHSYSYKYNKEDCACLETAACGSDGLSHASA